MNYFAVIHHEEGSAHGVHFPDVPDCFAAADEDTDILKNAIAALDDYFADGHEPPQPSGIDAIREAAAEDLAEGAYLLLVPYIERDTQTVRKNISMERGMWKAIDEGAELVAGGNRSVFLTLAARSMIEQIQRKH